MELTIDLPERFRLGDWQVCLKSMIIPSRVWNVYDESMPSWVFTSNTLLEGKGIENTIPQGNYKIVDILILIQFRLDALKVPVTNYLSDKNRVTLKTNKESCG